MAQGLYCEIWNDLCRLQKWFEKISKAFRIVVQEFSHIREQKSLHGFHLTVLQNSFINTIVVKTIISFNISLFEDKKYTIGNCM